MLPFNLTATPLSADSQNRLQLFYNRFCRGENRNRYGLGHLLYACHAAFPMLLTPDLGMLIWQNFKNYKSGISTKQIDAVAVSDFLLSPLCQQAGHKQYEVIPEIRGFLLLLLKDMRWFETNGIKPDTSGDRLTLLAVFLQQYLYTLKEATGTNIDNFKQANNWAVLAYLRPNQLAYEAAMAMNNTSAQAQMRINMYMEQVDMQYRDKVLQGGVESTQLDTFRTVYLLSAAQKEELFERNAFNHINEIDKRFITAKTEASKDRIQLPVPASAAERTERKIRGKQRMLSLLIGSGEGKNGNAPTIQSTSVGIDAFKQELDNLSNAGSFDCGEIEVIKGESATNENIIEALKVAYTKANEEDVILVLFSGHTTIKKEELFLVTHGKDTDGSFDLLSLSYFKGMLIEMKGSRGAQIILILNNAEGPVIIEPGQIADVVFCASTNLAINETDSMTDAFVHPIVECIHHTSGKITYRQLQKTVSHLMVDTQSKYPTPAIIANDSELDKYVFTHQVAPEDDTFILAYNKQHNIWQVLLDDFVVPSLEFSVSVLDFATGEVVGKVSHKLTTNNRDGVIALAGNVKLDTEKIYKVRVNRPPLFYKMEGASLLMSGGTQRSFDLNKFKQQVEGFRFGNLSPWGNLKELRPKESGGISFGLNAQGLSNGFEVVFTTYPFYKDTEHNSTPDEIRCKVENAEAAFDVIARFAKYSYLSSLTNFSQISRLGVSLFTIHEPGAATESPVDNNTRFIAETHNVNIINGHLLFKPLHLRIYNTSINTIFFAAFILASDMSITKIESFSGEVTAGATLEVNIDVSEMIKHMYELELYTDLKFLFSSNPIIDIFSQKGIK